MKKIIAVFIIVSIVFCFVGCDDNDVGVSDKNNPEPNTNISTDGGLEPDEYIPDEEWALKVLISNDELFDALEIVKAKKIITPTYAISENLDDRYCVLYYFSQRHNERHTYPISFVDFFKDENTVWKYSILVFDLSRENHKCNRPYDHAPLLHVLDNNKSEIEKYNVYPFINIKVVDRAVDISDKSLVTINVKSTVENSQNGTSEYQIFYNGEEILSVFGCYNLSNEDIYLLIDNLIVVKN